MLTVLGIDKEHKVKSIKVNNKNKEEVQKSLEGRGWTNITFLLSN